jgi:hypothetical protein
MLSLKRDYIGHRFCEPIRAFTYDIPTSQIFETPSLLGLCQCMESKYVLQVILVKRGTKGNNVEPKKP